MERGLIPSLEAPEFLIDWLTLPRDLTTSVEASCLENTNKPKFVLPEVEKHL